MYRKRTIRAKANETELAALRALAELDQRSVSETLRELVRAEAKRRGVWLIEAREEINREEQTR